MALKLTAANLTAILSYNSLAGNDIKVVRISDFDSAQTSGISDSSFMNRCQIRFFTRNSFSFYISLDKNDDSGDIHYTQIVFISCVISQEDI
ncbi:MAG: hypothetical protein CME32_31190 [Gimesia sp.]|nr:hypothetical protein [Gimesia sp.]